MSTASELGEVQAEIRAAFDNIDVVRKNLALRKAYDALTTAIRERDEARAARETSGEYLQRTMLIENEALLVARIASLTAEIETLKEALTKIVSIFESAVDACAYEMVKAARFALTKREEEP